MPNFSFTAPDGSKWDSEYEFKVATVLADAGIHVDRTEKPGDTLAYTTPVPRAYCLECGHTKCAQDRKYTADFRYASSSEQGFSYIEAKGFFRGNKRTLFGHIVQSLDADQLITVFQSDYKTGLIKTPGIVAWVQSKGGRACTFSELKFNPRIIYDV
jgi:hypothetical protein